MYKVDLNPSEEQLEDFEKKDQNLVSVEAYDDEGRKVDSLNVHIYLSRDAMLGLGKELIRTALKTQPQEGRHWHFDKPEKGADIIQSLGVVPHPKSLNFTILEADLGTTEEVYSSNKD